MRLNSFVVPIGMQHYGQGSKALLRIHVYTYILNVSQRILYLYANTMALMYDDVMWMNVSKQIIQI